MSCAYSSISFGGLGSSKLTCMDGNTEGHTSPPWAFCHTQPLPFFHTSSQWGCCRLSEAGWGTQGNTHNSNLHGNPCNVKPTNPPFPLSTILSPPPRVEFPLSARQEMPQHSRPVHCFCSCQCCGPFLLLELNVGNHRHRVLRGGMAHITIQGVLCKFSCKNLVHLV